MATTTRLRWRGGWILKSVGTLEPGAVGPYERVFGLDPFGLPVQLDTDSTVTISIAQIIQQWESSSGNVLLPLAYTDSVLEIARAARELEPITVTGALTPLPKIYGATGAAGDATSLQGTPIAVTAPAEGQALVFLSGSWRPGGWDKGPRVVVGNSVAGDTLAVCDYLDTGNGVQLAAALAAAGVGAYDVWIRPGTYTPAATLTAPAFTTVRGAGWGSVTIQATATNRKVLSVASTAVVESLFINVPVPAGGAAGTEIIEAASSTSLREIEIFMAAQNAGQAAVESLTACVRTVAADAGVFIERVNLTALSKRALGIAADFKGFEVQSRIAGAHSDMIGCSVINADIGFDLEGSVACQGWRFLGLGRIGMRLGASSGVNALRMSPAVTQGFVQITNIAGLPQFGVQLDTGSDAAGTRGAKVSDVSVQGNSAAVTSAGFSLIGTGDGAGFNNVSSQGFAIAADVGALQNRARVANLTSIGATLPSVANPTQDASGTCQFPNIQVIP